MNPEERVVSTSTLPRVSEPIARGRQQQSALLQKRGDSLASAPSDNDWVSPFTLPPLPALRRGRDHIDLLTSPDQNRQRGGSGTYYAAAWGSPYASPSPESISRIRARRSSFDPDFHSPPRIGNSPLAPDSSRARRSLSHLAASPVSRPQPARTTSERPNWLSDSDDSGGEKLATGKRTPQPNVEFGGWSPPPVQSLHDRSSPHSQRTHETHESTDTVTPETFATIRPRRSSRGVIPFRMAQIEEPSSEMNQETDVAKPLPTLPSSNLQSHSSPSKSNDPSSPLRPRLGSMGSSFRSQRRKVVWKGKNCIISLPMTDRESAGLTPVLSPTEVRDKLAMLRSQGYSTRGFELTDVDGTSATFTNGQSCAPYPDPSDMYSERQMRTFKVHIPDQSEWQKWVDYLQEEKLRALGVTSSDSEPPQTGPSPLSASLSRSSSRFQGTISPPNGTSSAASNPVRVTSNPFSPPYSLSSGRGSAVGSGASSQRQSMHAYKGSLALNPGQGRMASPTEFAPGRTSPFVPELSTHLRRATNFSPISAQGLQSLDHVVLSPLSEPASTKSHPGQPQGSYFPSISTGQTGSRVPEAAASSLSPPVVSPFNASAPRTPQFAQSPRPGPEIQHPTPRSHRHNLSAALQKEIDEAEAALAEQDLEDDRLTKDEQTVSKNEPKSAQTEDEHDDLPILKRPETMIGTDDQSDIITNPSLAGTPAIANDSNLFHNWQALSDAARGDRNQATRTPAEKSTQPRLNVEAKEFDPTAGFKSSNFNFGGTNAFTPAAAPFKPSVAAFKPGHAAKPSLSRFNVEAPAFVPGGPSQPPNGTTKSFAPVQSTFVFSAPAMNVEFAGPKEDKLPAVKTSPFAFSSASFNVDAPVFNPNSSVAKDLTSDTPVSATSSQPAKTSIFGNVVIEPGTQAMRRNKALPIVRPRSKDGPERSQSPTDSQEASEEEDESGRAPVPTDRAKRAKTVDSDGDRSPVYADSAPFTGNSKILSEIVDDASLRSPSPERTKEKPVDGWSYIPAETEDSAVERSPASRSPASSRKRMSSGRASPFEFDKELDVAKFNQARPHSRSSGVDRDILEDMPLSATGNLSPSPEPQHKSRSSLSALATPFEYIPVQPVSAQATPVKSQDQIESPSASTTKSAKSKGLVASRFAKSPSTALPSSPPLVAREPSSPLQLSDRPLSAPIHDAIPQDIKVSQTVEDTATSEVEDTFGESSPKHSATESHHVLSEANVSEGSPVVTLQHDRLTSLASSKYAPQNVHNLSLSSSRYGPQYDSPSVASPAYVPGRKELPKVEISDDGDDLMPSFEEIDAVMKQFEDNPELGIVRNDSPVQSTPLVDMRLGNNFRSDAPSPSPRRIDRPLEPTQAANATSFGLGLGIHRLNSGKEEVSDWNDAMSSAEEDKLQSRAHFFDGHVNDLVDGILETRLGPLERTLQTIQHSVALLATRPTSKRKSTSSDIRESDADDEDEYNAYEGFSTYRSRSPDAKRNRHASKIRAAVADGLAQYRESMPQQATQALDLSELRDELAELRELAQERSAGADLQAELTEMRQLLERSDNVQRKDLKRTLEDVIGSHPRLRGSRTEQDHGSSASNFKLQLDGLEAMLKVEQERAEHEARLRRQREADINELRQKLQDAEDDAAGQREATEMAEQNMEAFVQEKEAYKASEREVQRLNQMIDEQEENLNEYRRYKEERQQDLERLRIENNDLSDDLDASRSKSKDLSLDLEDERAKVQDLSADLADEKIKTKELTRTLWDVKDQLEERSKNSRALHSKTEQLRTEVASAVQNLGTEQEEWRRREHDLRTKLTMFEGALDSATREQHKAQVDHDYVAKQLKEAITYKDRFEHVQHDTAKLQEELSAARSNGTKYEDHSYRLERELHHVKEAKAAEIATATARLQAEADGARSQLEGHKSDSEARISRLQARLDTAEIDLEDHKAKYDAALSEAEENRKHALQEQSEKHEATLEEQRAGHDRHLADLRERHTRAMHNSSDDRHRMEHHYNEKIALGDDKVQHLESKIVDLDERLQVSKSAGRAAIEAAMARGANLPTPANSVVASPPQRAQSASLSLVKGTDLPEKISVQGLRETIMTLQEQLHDREQTIEDLRAELGKVDKELPNKLRAFETEAVWLREVLSVRIDDLEEIIQVVSKPDFDRESVRDAAIRLKTHIQMEQQLRERAASNAGFGAAPSLPSVSDLVGYVQSPRTVLPMAAQAAWGNLRKARDVSMNAFGHLASEYAATPSKTTRAVSPAGSYSSTPMTPPNTIQGRRTSSNSDASMKPPPPAMRPLAAAAAARRMNTPLAKPGGSLEARPLRAFSSQPRALRIKSDLLDAKESLADRDENQSPQTPTLSKGREEIDLGADVDEDASPLDAQGELHPFEDIAPKPVES